MVSKFLNSDNGEGEVNFRWGNEQHSTATDLAGRPHRVWSGCCVNAAVLWTTVAGGSKSN